MAIPTDPSALRHVIAGLRLVKMRHGLLPRDAAAKQEMDQIWRDATANMSKPVMTDVELDGLIVRLKRQLP